MHRDLCNSHTTAAVGSMPHGSMPHVAWPPPGASLQNGITAIVATLSCLPLNPAGAWLGWQRHRMNGELQK